MRYYVYVLYNLKHDKFYIGQTYSLLKRVVNEHKVGLGNYTSRYDGKWLFIYYESYNTRGEAMGRERYLKSFKSKTYLKQFIKSKRGAISSVG